MLPFSVFGHSCVAYEEKVIVIGGYNSSEGNSIFKIVFCITNYIITFIIQAISFVEKHNQLEDRRTELRRNSARELIWPITFLYLYR